MVMRVWSEVAVEHAGRGTSEATTVMPWSSLSRDECRLVSCPECGAGVTDKCSYPGLNNPAARRQSVRIHRRRVLKAKEYRSERRI